MRTCLFSSYFVGNALPHRVRRYVTELRRHFHRVVLITNEGNDLSGECGWLAQQQVELRQVRNEGYDFGMWHKLLVPMDLAPVQRLALVNDSCVLFATLDETLAWMEASAHDACGITDSFQHHYHLQSYFLYLKRPVLSLVQEFFREKGLATGGFWDVVGTYELGLSEAMTGAGFSLGARWTVRGSRFSCNPSMEYLVPLLRAGMPMLKRKALLIKPSWRYFKSSLQQIANGYLPDPWSYVEQIRVQHRLPGQEVHALFGDLLPDDPRSRRLNELWPPVFRLWRAMHLPVRRIAGLGG